MPRVKKAAVLQQRACSKEKANNRSNIPSDPFTSSIFKTLNDSQKSVAGHNRCMQSFWRQCKQHERGAEQVLAALQPAIDRILVVFKREPAVERLVKFLTLVCINDPNPSSNSFMNHLMAYLLNKFNAKDKAVRFRSCQLVAAILNEMDAEADISEELFVSLLDNMLLRVVDKIPAVRLEAIAGLSRLQGEEEDDAVVKEYIRILTTDSNKDCRKAVLKYFAISEFSIDMILLRVRDTSSDVRKEAYKTIKNKLTLSNLTIKQRNWLLKSGLEERDVNVKKVCGALIALWLKGSNSDVIQLLESMDVENYESEGEILLQYLLEDLDHIKSTPMPPYTQEDMTPEKALFWRKLCEVLAGQSDKEVLLDSCLPDTVQLCQLINGFSVSSQPADVFTLQQLLKLTHCVDLQDEAGRRQLESFCRELLSDNELEDEMTPAIMKVLRTVYGTDTSGYIRSMMEVISNLRDPVEGSATQEATEIRDKLENRMATLHNELEELKAEEQIMKQMEKTEEVDTIKKSMVSIAQEIHGLESKLGSGVFQDEGTWLRMLTILVDLLQHMGSISGHAQVGSVVELTINPALELGTDNVRKMGLKCLGLYCLLDKDAAKSHMSIFASILKKEDSRVIKIADVKALCDLITVYGDYLWDEEHPDNDEEKAQISIKEEIIGELAKLLVLEDQEDLELVALATELFAKFSLFQRSYDSSVIQQLLLLYFDPSTEDSVEIRQCLSVFFPSYVSALLKPDLVSKNGNLLRESLVPVLTTIQEAPRKSTLSKISCTTVCQFVVHLLDSKLKQPQKSLESKHDNDVPEETDTDTASDEPPSQHAKLAIDICMFILYEPVGPLCKVLSQTLGLLVLTSGNQSTIKQLQVLLENVLDNIKDKMAIKNVKKFQQMVLSLDLTPTDSLEEVKELVQSLQQEAMRRLEVTAKPKTAKKLSKTSNRTKGPAIKTKAKQPKKAKRKPKYVDESSSDDEDVAPEKTTSSDDEEVVVAPVPRRAATRTRKTVNYKVELSDEESEEETEESEEFSDSD